MFPNDLTIDALGTSLRGLGLRHQAIAQNVANADVPGYQRVDVSFEGALGQALAGDDIAQTLPDERLDGREPQYGPPGQTVVRVGTSGVSSGTNTFRRRRRLYSIEYR